MSRPFADHLALILADINGRARYQHEPDGRDQWQTPAELFRTGAGDCEDFAIAYWDALRGTTGRHRIACLVLNGYPEPHMVCTTRPSPLAAEWVLDVLADVPYRLADRSDLVMTAYQLGEEQGGPAAWHGGIRLQRTPAKWVDAYWRLMA